ncbi:MAG: hypothetical protein LQ340_007979, partial [Diploschistes diacapsis]
IGGVYLIAFATFIPETGRKIVGNGSLPPTEWFNRSVLSELARRREAKNWADEEEAVTKRQEVEELARKTETKMAQTPLRRCA